MTDSLKGDTTGPRAAFRKDNMASAAGPLKYGIE